MHHIIIVAQNFRSIVDGIQRIRASSIVLYEHAGRHRPYLLFFVPTVNPVFVRHTAHHIAFHPPAIVPFASMTFWI